MFSDLQQWYFQELDELRELCASELGPQKEERRTVYKKGDKAKDRLGNVGIIDMDQFFDGTVLVRYPTALGSRFKIWCVNTLTPVVEN